MRVPKKNTLSKQNAKFARSSDHRPVVRLGQASRTARWCLAGYLLLTIYASLHPLTGWRDLEVAPWSFLFDRWPIYLTSFDFWSNIAAYLPIGILTVFSLSPQWHRGLTWAIASLVGASVSLLMEGAQSYLPLRVPALSDFLANSVGAAIGATLAILFARRILGSMAVRTGLSRMLAPQAAPLLVLLMFWIVAQLHPVSVPFLTGRIAPQLLTWMAGITGEASNATVFDPSQALSAEQFVLIQTVLGSLSLAALLCVMRCAIADRTSRVLWIAATFLGVILVKLLASSLQYGPDQAWVWFTQGAQQALMLAAFFGVLIALLPRGLIIILGVLLLTVQMVLANALADNPYFIVSLTRWHQGRFINFFGLTQWVSGLWPFAALVVLLVAGGRHHSKNK